MIKRRVKSRNLGVLCFARVTFKSGPQPATMDLLLALLMLGVWGSFMAYGWVLEDIKSTPWGEAHERFTDTDFLILAQSVGNAVVAAGLLLFLKDGPVLHRCCPTRTPPHVLL